MSAETWVSTAENYALLLRESERREQELRAELERERNMSVCDKLDRERQTKRHWRGRAEAAEKELAKLRAKAERVCRLTDLAAVGNLNRQAAASKRDRAIEELRDALQADTLSGQGPDVSSPEPSGTDNVE